MRLIERIPEIEGPLRLTDEKRGELSRWITTELTDALSATSRLQRTWREALRRYEGVPKNPTKNTPVPNAPNLEVTIGAIAVDSMYSQSLDLVYSVSPPVTVRSTNADPDNVADAKSIQIFANRLASTELDMRRASEEAFLDNIQLGTGIYYVPWVEMSKKTRTHRVIDRGPKVLYHPVEDYLVPLGPNSNPQRATWLGLRFWLTYDELSERAAFNTKWDISNVAPCGNTSWVRSRRENLGHVDQQSSRQGDLYEIWDIYAYYDIDGDGIAEDLYVVFDMTSMQVICAAYNPYDMRPVEEMIYQRRSGIPYGLGIMEMLAPYEDEITEIHNHRVLNMLLANARIWKGRNGQVSENLKIWPNKVILMDDPDSLQPEQMGDIYPSSAQAELMALSLAERRAGVNELSPGGANQMIGSRTPGITALSALQQASKRFTAAFDGMRLGTANAVKQGLRRYHERLLSGDQGVADYILETFGPEDGRRIITVLSKPNFMRQMEVEMTASSASLNREADRQNAVMLINVLAQYYQRTLELVTIASNPMTPPAVREVAARIAEAVGEVIDRTVRTFDQVRDPQSFVVEVNDIIEGLQGQEDLMQLSNIVTMMTQGGGEQGGMGQAAPAGAPSEG